MSRLYVAGVVRFVKRKVRDWVRGAVRWWLWVVSWARVEGERGGRVEGRVRVSVVARVRGRERRGRCRRVERCIVNGVGVCDVEMRWVSVSGWGEVGVEG